MLDSLLSLVIFFIHFLIIKINFKSMTLCIEFINGFDNF